MNIVLRDSGTMASWFGVSGVVALGLLWVGGALAAADSADRGLVDGGSAHRHVKYLNDEERSGRDASRGTSAAEACCFEGGPHLITRLIQERGNRLMG